MRRSRPELVGALRTWDSSLFEVKRRAAIVRIAMRGFFPLPPPLGLKQFNSPCLLQYVGARSRRIISRELFLLSGQSALLLIRSSRQLPCQVVTQSYSRAHGLGPLLYCAFLYFHIQMMKRKLLENQSRNPAAPTHSLDPVQTQTQCTTSRFLACNQLYLSTISKPEAYDSTEERRHAKEERTKEKEKKKRKPVPGRATVGGTPSCRIYVKYK